jgi:cell division protein FtsA
LGGPLIQVQLAKGVVGVSRPESEIREDDVHRVLESARSVVNPANFEILHILPRRFSIDGQQAVKDPIGMQGIRLEVDAQIVQGQAAHVRNSTKAFFRTGVDITELVFTPLASAQAVASSRQKDVGVAVVNIGASTTSVAVYEEGELIHAAVIPIGADHITSDIAIGLRTSLEVAEQVKRNVVSANADEIPKHEMIDLVEFGAPQSEIVGSRFVSDVAQARVEEIFERVEKELKKIQRSGLLPAGAILTGGGVKLRGMVEVAKRVLRLPALVAGASQLQTPMQETLHDPSFSTAVGLVLWGFDGEREPRLGAGRGFAGAASRGGDFMKRLGSPLKKIFKSFIP